jgi:amino acid transporter
MDRSESTSSPEPRLGLWDSLSIILGIVVGTAIFKTPAAVFQNTNGPWAALGAWLLGGLISLCGAFCYAELATAYPRDGGDYEYLSRAFGRWVGFLFGWAQLTVIVVGNIGIMAYAFADYAARIWPSLAVHKAPLAVLPVVLLSAANASGAAAGKTTQNVLTLAKVFGLVGVILGGLWAGGVGHGSAPPLATEGGSSLAAFGLAMIFVLYAYGGWEHAAFVAAEVRDQHRNLPRALLLGIAGISAIYLATNVAYLAALGFEGARQSPTPAADVLQQALGPWGATAISLLVMCSALGAINGMIFTASRMFAVWGGDFPRLAWLGGWNRQTAAPVAAIAAQGLMAVLMILAVGTEHGQWWFDRALAGVGFAGLPWDEYFGGFETLVAGTAPIFWAFFLLTGVALFVLRLRDPATPRPFPTPLYPLTPLVFCATCASMLYASVAYAGWLSLLGLVPLALGVPVYCFARHCRDE